LTHIEERRLLDRIRALAAAELAGREANLEPFFKEADRLLDDLDSAQGARDELLALLDDLEEVLEVFVLMGAGGR